MNHILVVGEIENKEIKRITQELISAANQVSTTLNKKVELCLIGNESSSLSKTVKGVKTLYFCDTEDFFDIDSVFTTLYKLVEQIKPSIILFPHSNQGKDLSAKLSAKLRSGIVADIVNIKTEGNDLIVQKSIYSGKAYANMKVISDVKIFTVRPNSIEINNFEQEAELKSIELQKQNRLTFSNKEVSENKKIELTEASIIVSGGRGIKDPKNWPILQSLADSLGAALGASRSVVDSGWISHSHQVGQTGKTVSPNCYIACGISGAIQHMAGMGSSKCIVAINTDKEAPIFKVATYGVVGDLFEVVPALTEEVKKVLS